MSAGYDYKQYAILYVDDEEKSLKYFRKAYEDDFVIHTATSVAEAWKIIDKDVDHHIGVVISDQRMPEETGVSLLTELKSKRSDIIRMLTTAYTEIEDAITAVNAGAIYKYIVKPWSSLDDLKTELKKALEFCIVQRERDMLRSEKLSSIQKIVMTDRLQNLTTVAMSMSGQFRNPLYALKSYLDVCPIQTRYPNREESYTEFEDVCSKVLKSNRHMLTAIQKLTEVTVKDVEFDEVKLEDLIYTGVSHAKEKAKVEEKLNKDLPSIKANSLLMERFFDIALTRLATVCQEKGTLVITASSSMLDDNRPGIDVRLIVKNVEGDGAKLPEDFFTVFDVKNTDAEDMNLDVLALYFLVHHHSGEFKLLDDGNLGFAVLLPIEPSAQQVDAPAIEEVLDTLYRKFEREDLGVLRQS